MENIYIKSVELIKDLTPLKAKTRIDFNKSITVIVGDNGVGKSTLIECICDEFGHKDETYLKRPGMKSNVNIELSADKPGLKYIDFHAHDRKYAGSFGSDISLQMMHMKASSGQVSISLINKLFGNKDSLKNKLVILDEPCRGQSVRNQIRVSKLITGLVGIGCQVILTTHSFLILRELRETAQYYDITKNADTTYDDYISEQLS